jgi:hypothetical protein
VNFVPAATGSRIATLTIYDDQGLSSQQINLTGTGTIVSLSTRNLAFGNDPVGKPKLLPVTITNVSTNTFLHLTAFAISGTNASDYTNSSNCVSTISPGSSCTFNVTFTPSAQGFRSATLSITDDGGGSPQTVVITGNGT